MSARAILDANVVLGAHPRGDAETLTVDALLARLDQFGVGAALVRHADAIFYDAAAGNAALVDAIRTEPRLHAAFVVGPLDCGEHGGPGGLTDLLDAHDVRAVWLYPRSHGWSVRGPESVTLLDELYHCERPIFVELDECGWDDVAFLADRLPGVDLVVCGVGYRTLRQAYAVLAKYETVRIDTSQLSAHNGLEQVAARFGAGRLCFGTASPLRDAGGAHHRLARSDLAAPERTAVGATTCAQSAGIETPEPLSPAVPPELPSGGIVDAHAHIGLWPSSYLPAPHADDLVATMDRTGTSVSVISAMRALWSGDVRVGNADALDAATRHPGRLYVHAVANPHRREDRDHLVDVLGRNEVRGIKVHPDTHGCPLDDRRYDWIFELALEAGVPVLGHSFGGTPHSDPSQFGTVAGRHPQLTLVAGHSGATPDGFRATIAAGRERPNLYAEICGSWMTGWWLRQLVDALGADHVLHGTDATLIDPRYGIGRVLYAGLKDDERDLVLAGNARRLYGLETHDS